MQQPSECSLCHAHMCASRRGMVSQTDRPTKPAERLRTSPTSESRGLRQRSLRLLHFSVTHRLRFVWWDFDQTAIFLVTGRWRVQMELQAVVVSRCNPSQCVPDSSAQCFHTGEHYIRLVTGFRAKHNVIRYLHTCWTPTTKNQLIPSARPPCSPWSRFGESATPAFEHRKKSDGIPPRHGDRPVPPMSVSTISCQLMHPVRLCKKSVILFYP